MPNASQKLHPSFELHSEHRIESLDVTVQEFTHTKTGAQHIHLASKSEENVFLVALRTVPEDSTGVAHILEHTALCGSEKYPVRDPFFMMTRRSLNTFMNAFTSSDWTAYPVASLNKKDFSNLVDVYLDAVFFSRLDKLDFAQEGHRLEFETPEDSSSPLEFKGVVFNEMKGAMSSVTSQLWHTLTKYLFPTSTYHHNSGGEPEHIPDLSYEALVSFYKTHYHPSNAIFMTFGDIPANEHQSKFEAQALQSFNKLDKEIAVTDEKRYFAPVKVEEFYANNDADIEEKTHVVMAWLLGKSANLHDSLRAQLLSSILLDNSASPLMLALESTDLASAPSPLCGLDDSQKELSFVCGLSGTKADASDAVEALIVDTLKNVAKNGVDPADVESALHQLELHQREIGGDSYPYGLQLILKSLTSANHRGDPASLLDLEKALAQLRKDILDPHFVQNLIQTLLLDNPHLVRLTLIPNSEIAERKKVAERERLDAISKQLSEQEKQAIVDQALALKARQDAEDDPGSLPKVTLSDVPKKERRVSGEAKKVNGCDIHAYRTGTNGIVYQQAILDLPTLDNNELSHLSFYSHCVPELGCGEHSYLDMQKRQSAVSGGVSAFSAIRGHVSDPSDCSGYYVYSSKALSKNHRAISELKSDILEAARFDEHERIQEIVSQIRVGMEQSVTGNGHVLAMSAAAAGCSYAAKLGHDYSGLKAIQTAKAFDLQVNQENNVDMFAQNLKSLHDKISKQSAQFLIIGEDNVFSDLNATLGSLLSPRQSATQFKPDSFVPRKIQQGWICNTQVSFCAKAFPTVGLAHADSAALVVLGNYLRNNFLHKAIREQGGAYGGGASQDNNGASFRFYSYRDPRIVETLDDFDASIKWLLQHKQSKQKLEEAILGTISGLDRSESPAGQAKRCFYAELHGRTPELRDQYRSQVVTTKFDDLIRVAETYLQPEHASTVVVTGKDNEKTVEKLNLDVIEL